MEARDTLRTWENQKSRGFSVTSQVTGKFLPPLNRDGYPCHAKGSVGSREPAGSSGEKGGGPGSNLARCLSRNDGLAGSCFLLARDLYSDACLNWFKLSKKRETGMRKILLLGCGESIRNNKNRYTGRVDVGVEFPFPAWKCYWLKYKMEEDDNIWQFV
jgi:hypothetical protein